jgi:hypothetical protein
MSLAVNDALSTQAQVGQCVRLHLAPTALRVLLQSPALGMQHDALSVGVDVCSVLERAGFVIIEAGDVVELARVA